MHVRAVWALMQAHHYLGALPGIGETLRYVAHHRGQWLALVVFSAPALKCAARDRWIGWSFGVQFDRLHLLTNNSRFLLLPGAPRRAHRTRAIGPRAPEHGLSFTNEALTSSDHPRAGKRRLASPTTLTACMGHPRAREGPPVRRSISFVGYRFSLARGGMI